MGFIRSLEGLQSKDRSSPQRRGFSKLQHRNLVSVPSLLPCGTQSEGCTSSSSRLTATDSRLASALPRCLGVQISHPSAPLPPRHCLGARKGGSLAPLNGSGAPPSSQCGGRGLPTFLSTVTGSRGTSLRGAEGLWDPRSPLIGEQPQTCNGGVRRRWLSAVPPPRPLGGLACVLHFQLKSHFRGPWFSVREV